MRDKANRSKEQFSRTVFSETWSKLGWCEIIIQGEFEVDADRKSLQARRSSGTNLGFLIPASFGQKSNCLVIHRRRFAKRSSSLTDKSVKKLKTAGKLISSGTRYVQRKRTRNIMMHIQIMNRETI